VITVDIYLATGLTLSREKFKKKVQAKAPAVATGIAVARCGSLALRLGWD
jgi:hypothetical protein